MATIFTKIRNSCLFTTPWADSDAWSKKWNHDTQIIDLDSKLLFDGEFDDWHKIEDIALQLIEVRSIAKNEGEYWRKLAVVSFCRLLLIARPAIETEEILKEEEPYPITNTNYNLVLYMALSVGIIFIILILLLNYLS